MTATDSFAHLLSGLVRDHPGNQGLQVTALTAVATAADARERTHLLKTLAKDTDLASEVLDSLLADPNPRVRAAAWRYQPWGETELLAQATATESTEILVGIIGRPDLSERVAKVVVARAAAETSTGRRAPLWAALKNGHIPAGAAADAFAACLGDFVAPYPSGAGHIFAALAVLERYDVALAVAADPRIAVTVRLYGASKLHTCDALPAVRAVTELVEAGDLSDPRLRLDLPEDGAVSPLRWGSLLAPSTERWVAAAQVHEAVADLVATLSAVAGVYGLGTLRHDHLSAGASKCAPRADVVAAALRDPRVAPLENLFESAPTLRAQLFNLAICSPDLRTEQLDVMSRYVDTSEEAVAEALEGTPAAAPSPALTRYPDLWAERAIGHIRSRQSGRVLLPQEKQKWVVDHTVEYFLTHVTQWPEDTAFRMIDTGVMTEDQLGRLPARSLLEHRSYGNRTPAVMAVMAAAFAQLGTLDPRTRGIALEALTALLDSTMPLSDLVAAITSAA